jgi:nucleoside-diphosphate-sugar epimerase
MIFLTGSSGFVGSSILNYFKNEDFFVASRGNETKFHGAKIVIHLAGKAHDLKNDINSSEYYEVNTDLTKMVFDAFVETDAKVFVFLSSVKAIADELTEILTENHIPNPITYYGKSKLLAEQYILFNEIPRGKRVYILRPCMIHGPGNRGNLNMLFEFASKGIPWPLGAFENKRSFCSIDNLLFIIQELIEREDIPSGVYNVADDEPISTNELILLIAQSIGKNPKIYKISKWFVRLMARIGDLFYISFNTERLQKLTSTYLVSNSKIKHAMGKPLPLNSRDGLLKTFKAFK